MRSDKSRITLSATMVLLFGLCSHAADLSPGSKASIPPPPMPVFDVPRLEGISVDGDATEWGDRGFRVDALSDPDVGVKPIEDFDVHFRLGWDDRGLLLFATVKDSTQVEADKPADLWKADSLELYMGDRIGGKDYWQVDIAPGVDPKYPALRTHFFDYRKKTESHRPALHVDAARKTIPGGYTLEVCLPWDNLGITPAMGRELAMQVYFVDSGKPEASPGQYIALKWFPRGNTYNDTTAMHRLRLSKKPSKPMTASLTGRYEDLRQFHVQVVGDRELAGKTAVLKDGKQELGQAVLKNEGGRATADIKAPMPPAGHPYQALTVQADHRDLGPVIAPDPDRARARAMVEITPRFQSCVFYSPRFPRCEFEDPWRIESYIGPYEIRVKYYDTDYNEVTTAEKPGRYGAVIDIEPVTGRPIRRYATLYRAAKPADWYNPAIKASFVFPPEWGINPKVAALQQDSISEIMKEQFFDSFSRSDDAAMLLAWLSGLNPSAGPATAANDAESSNRQWWVGLKRKLTGFDKKYPHPFVCPKPIIGAPAPVVHEGTLQEAGMKADAAEKMDAVLTQWSKEVDQGFAVCIVRHGVIVLHKAYGMREGRPMTVQTPSHMASVTKLMSASLMWMLIDQGWVDLDDPVDKYLPAFRDIPVVTPLTIRHCYTHTGGLWGHWGDNLNDLEERLSIYYPYLEVGYRREYNGLGNALGSKIIEVLSGESIPQFYKHHLLDPLGCTHTEVKTTSTGAQSIPLDMARIGQMLLNGGAYGDKRFFSEATFKRMLPVPLTKTLGEGTPEIWGVGMGYWWGLHTISKNTFGHGAGSSATFKISPDYDLVVSITRNEGGKNFNDYFLKFVRVLLEGIADQPVVPGVTSEEEDKAAHQ